MSWVLYQAALQSLVDHEAPSSGVVLFVCLGSGKRNIKHQLVFMQ